METDRHALPLYLLRLYVWMLKAGHSIRYEFGIFVMKGLLRQFNQHGVITQHQMRDNLAEKDKIVEDLEHMLESKYLRYCDPLSTLR